MALCSGDSPAIGESSVAFASSLLAIPQWSPSVFHRKYVEMQKELASDEPGMVMRSNPNEAEEITGIPTPMKPSSEATHGVKMESEGGMGRQLDHQFQFATTMQLNVWLMVMQMQCKKCQSLLDLHCQIQKSIVRYDRDRSAVGHYHVVAA